MNTSTKEQIGCDAICKSHSARTERELYRICPSKISKRELEDLYFALLENNLELKKSINIYQDKVKVLSTKLQRMTVQKNVAGKEKDCCASKAVVSEQKESITDLKKANERMADRIRILNMRLCSAKQFLKRSPSQSTNCKTCPRCSFKNSSMSALNPSKKSESMTRTTAVSCQSLVKDVSEKATGTVETVEVVDKSNIQKSATEDSCNENKCRTTMDELKEKISNLQEELATSHNEYSQRIAKLEAIVSELRDENTKVRGEHAASEHSLQQSASRADQLQYQLRTADAKCNELNMELSIEKRKVAELETGLKLANLSNHVMETIEQLAATKVQEKQEDEKEQAAEALEQEPQTQAELSRDFSRVFYIHNNEKKDSYQDEIDLNVIEISRESSRSQKNEEMASSSKILELPTQRKSTDIKTSRSDDSGYTELNKSCEADDDQAMVKINRELLKKIADLQTQLDLVKITAAGKPVESEYQLIENPKAFESYDYETNDVNEPSALRLMEDLNTMLMRDTPPDGATDQNYQSKPEVPDELNASVVHQTESSASKPWEDLLVQNESVEDNMQNDVQSLSNSTKVKFDTKAPRNDDHNSYQIPGPIPAVYPSQNAKDKRRNLRNNQSKESVDRPRKKTSAESKTVKIFENNANENTSTIDKDDTLNDSEHADLETGTSNERSRRRSIDARLANRTPTRDSIYVTKKKLTQDGTMAEVKKESETSYYFDSVCTPPIAGPSDLLKETATQVDETLDNETQIDPPGQRRDSATYMADAPHTYTVQAERHSRATSPGNTEQEISSLSDLPSEKDGNIPGNPGTVFPGESCAPLSPGEAGPERTTTYTDTETDTHDIGSLSEGEMPAVKVRNLSIGEWHSNLTTPAATSSARMEATLQSISEELARCRRLLLSQRDQENGSSANVQRELKPAEEVAIELRHSAANRHIVESASLSCLFILHIGTLVLSDESMLYCRDKSLALTWRFYTQNAAMTRVQSARVVQFDFVTEYDVAFNDDFLDYMKHSSMSIVLCEMNKQEEPFAMCSLPLREALLHANRRADMSLALLPVRSDGTRHNIGEEIGILDLWCTLRVDVSLMPTIYRVMHTSSPTNLVYPNPIAMASCESSIMQQVDEEVSSERLSRDLDLSVKGRNISGKQSTYPELFSEKFKPKGSETDIRSSTTEHNSSRYDEEVQGYQAKRPYRRRSTQTQKSTPSSNLGRRGVVGFQNRWPNVQLRQESSGIIINEVPTTIRSKDEMKLALERNVQHGFPRMAKIDDKNSAVRHQISQLRSIKNKQQISGRVDSLEELLKKKPSSLEDSSNTPTTATEVRKDQDERAKMINISKYVGNTVSTPDINQIVETSKKCVKYNDVLSCDDPDKEDSSESADNAQSIDITILWLALNEECEAMVDPGVQRLYVAYSFLGRQGAELETPVSLPKPRHYADKCYFNFKKTFHLHESDLPLLGHMSRCRAGGGSCDPRDCIVFTLVSEPSEDPLGLSNCEDVGYAYLYLGDVLAYSGDSAGYTEVVGVRGVRGGVCGVLAVRVAPLPVLRRARALAPR